MRKPDPNASGIKSPPKWTVIGRIADEQNQLRYVTASDKESAITAFCSDIAKAAGLKVSKTEFYVDYVFNGILDPCARSRYVPAKSPGAVSCVSS